MSWCLDCHRDPSRFIRPKEEVFNMTVDSCIRRGDPGGDRRTVGQGVRHSRPDDAHQLLHLPPLKGGAERTTSHRDQNAHDKSCHDQPKNVGYDGRGSWRSPSTSTPCAPSSPSRVGRSSGAASRNSPATSVSATWCIASFRARRRSGSNPPAWNGRRVAPQLPQALDRVAGARRPDRLHPPAARAHRAVRATAGRDRPREALVLRQRGDAWRLRPGRPGGESPGPAHQGRGQPRPRVEPRGHRHLRPGERPGALRPGPLADRDLPRQRPLLGGVPPVLAAGARSRARGGGAGIRLLTGAVTSPTLVAQIEAFRGQLPAGPLASVGGHRPRCGASGREARVRRDRRRALRPGAGRRRPDPRLRPPHHRSWRGALRAPVRRSAAGVERQRDDEPPLHRRIVADLDRHARRSSIGTPAARRRRLRSGPRHGVGSDRRRRGDLEAERQLPLRWTAAEPRS